PADPRGVAVDLVLTHDLMGAARAVLVLDLDRGAEEDLVALLLARIDDHRVREPLREVAHAAIDLSELFFAVDVLRVLGPIALCGRVGHLLDDAGALGGAKPGELIGEAASAFGGDVIGADCHGGALHSMTAFSRGGEGGNRAAMRRTPKHLAVSSLLFLAAACGPEAPAPVAPAPAPTPTPPPPATRVGGARPRPAPPHEPTRKL